MTSLDNSELSQNIYYEAYETDINIMGDTCSVTSYDNLQIPPETHNVINT